MWRPSRLSALSFILLGGIVIELLSIYFEVVLVRVRKMRSNPEFKLSLVDDTGIFFQPKEEVISQLPSEHLATGNSFRFAS